MKAREEIDRLLNDDYLDEEEGDWIGTVKDDVGETGEGDYKKLKSVVQQDLDSRMYYSEN